MTSKKVFLYLGIGAGVISIIYGISCMSLNVSYSGDFSSFASFGADFYTYIYEATMNAANNIDELGNFLETVMKTVVNGIGMFMISIGMADIAFFGCKLADYNKEIMETKREEAQIVTQPVPENIESRIETNKESNSEIINSEVSVTENSNIEI